MKIGFVSLLTMVITGVGIGLAIAGLPAAFIIGGLAAICVVLITVYYPVITIGVLLAVVPLNVLWTGAEGISPLEVGYGLTYIFLLLCWILKKIRAVIFGTRTHSISSPVTVPMVVFLGWAVMACAVGIAHGHPFRHWGSDLNALMFYALCFVVLDTIKGKRTLAVLFGIMSLSLAVGIFDSFSSLRMVNTSPGVAIAAPALPKVRNVSLMSLSMLMVALACVTHCTGWHRKIFYGALTFLFAAMLAISFARSIWIAAVFGAAFLFFASLAYQKRSFLKMVMAAVIISALYVAVAFSVPSNTPLFKTALAIEKRYESIFTAWGETPIVTRGAEFRVAMRKALQYPVIGNGLGTPITYFRYDKWYGVQMWDTSRYIHNAYLYFFLNMGLVGLCAFLWLGLSLVWYGMRIYSSVHDEVSKALALGITAAFAASMAASLAGPLFSSPFLTMWFGFFTGTLIYIDTSRPPASR